MFYTNIKISEKYDYLSEKFRKAYEWLRKTDLEELAVGSYQIMGEQVVANVQEYTTLPVDVAKYEAHDKYFDIQYIVSGVESFGICKREDLIEDTRRSESDLIFYKEPELSGHIILTKGDFVVVAPEDAHKPKCMVKEPSEVKKVVVKVMLDTE